MSQPVFLFPGQGSQFAGMGRDLHDGFESAREVFEEADGALGFELSKLIFEGPEEQLNLTEFTQPAILTVSIAAYRVLMERTESHLQPAFLAGHSLGEYSAHVAAGTLTLAEAVRVVRNRGRYMQEAVPDGEGAMAAILGMPADQINDLCAQASDEHTETPPAVVNPDAPGAGERSAVESAPGATTASDPDGSRAAAVRSVVAPANLNSPDQTVISGSRAAVLRAMELCKAAGAKRTLMLQVSAPFHCALMQPAQDRLASDLEGLMFNDPSVPVVANVDARAITRRSDVRDCLIRQVTGPVRWVECMQLLIQQGAGPFIEVGPSKVLSGLLRQIDRDQTRMNVEDTASLEKTLAALTAVQV